MRDDPLLPDVFTRPQAVDAGLSRHQVTHRIGNGQWHVLVRGAYCRADRWQASTPHERHLLLARAVLATRREPVHAFSHVTAAVLHDLPVSTSLLHTVWSTAPSGFGHSTRYAHVLRREIAALSAADVVERRGLPSTSRLRTIADCLRHLPLTEAVPLADAALHDDPARPHGLTVQHLVEVLAAQSSWPYASAAARALPLIDPRRESVLESRAGIVIARHGLPAPVPQAVIRDEDGDFVARVDFFWPEYGVVGEADGAAKYRTDDPVRVIRAEKDRQARLEALGLIVVRWDWRHLVGDLPELVVRLRRALAAGDAARFRGHVA